MIIFFFYIFDEDANTTIPVEIDNEYNEELEFFFDDKRDVQSIKLEPGVFTVLYPHEAHKPQMNFRGCENVKKVVVKIKN